MGRRQRRKQQQKSRWQYFYFDIETPLGPYSMSGTVSGRILKPTFSNLPAHPVVTKLASMTDWVHRNVKVAHAPLLLRVPGDVVLDQRSAVMRMPSGSVVAAMRLNYRDQQGQYLSALLPATSFDEDVIMTRRSYGSWIRSGPRVNFGNVTPVGCGCWAPHGAYGLRAMRMAIVRRRRCALIPWSLKRSDDRALAVTRLSATTIPFVATDEGLLVARPWVGSAELSRILSTIAGARAMAENNLAEKSREREEWRRRGRR